MSIGIALGIKLPTGQSNADKINATRKLELDQQIIILSLSFGKYQ
jgi:hypothetical protein